MRWFRSHPAYDVTFTLVNQQPDIKDVTWDIRHAVNGEYRAVNNECHAVNRECHIVDGETCCELYVML